MRSWWGLLSKQFGVVARVGTRLGPRSFELSWSPVTVAFGCRNPPEPRAGMSVFDFFRDQRGDGRWPPMNPTYGTRLPVDLRSTCTGNEPMIQVHVDLSVLLIVTYNFDRAPILHSVFKNLFKDV